MKMNIVIPIGGNNRGDLDDAYISNLHEIGRKTLLQHIYESLAGIANASFIVVMKREDAKAYHLDNIVSLMIPGVKIVLSEGETRGAACTCLLAADEIDNDQPLLIASGNQLVSVDLQEVVAQFEREKLDGGILIFEDIHPRWSYVKLDERDLVMEAAEKKPISKNATAGFYYFHKGADFVNAAKSMIKKNAQTDGLFYVCPVYNELILRDQKIGVHRIDKRLYFNFNEKKDREAYETLLREKKIHD